MLVADYSLFVDDPVVNFVRLMTFMGMAPRQANPLSVIGMLDLKKSVLMKSRFSGGVT